MDQATNASFGNSGQRPARPVMEAMWRGFRCRCPHCGEGKLFRAFIKVADHCPECGEPFYHHRADDLPAYIVVVIAGHIVVAAFMAVEQVGNLALWQHLAIWIPITILSCIAMLQPVKGAVVGLQWALRMHGFGGSPESLETHPDLGKVERSPR